VNDRPHLSIGEVMSLLQDEFPDITISKIRFLESQGLLDPERTPSGYRKFYELDLARLRWILTQQREHFLPLRVIKDRLDAGFVPDGGGGGAPFSAPPLSSQTTAGAVAAAPGASALTAAAGGGPEPTPGVPVVSEPGAAGPVVGGPGPPERPGSPRGQAPAQDQGRPQEAAPSARAAATGRAGASGSGRAGRGGSGPGAGPRRGGAWAGRTSDGDDGVPGPVGGTGHNGTQPLPSLGGFDGGDASAGGADDPGAGADERGGGGLRVAPGARGWDPGAADRGGEAAEDPDGPRTGYTDPSTGRDDPAAGGTGAGGASDAGADLAQRLAAGGRRPPDLTALSMSLTELAAACGQSVAELKELERFGLIAGERVGSEVVYREDALLIARLAGRFDRHGIEPRHLRQYRVAAEREVALMEQVVAPVLLARGRTGQTGDAATSGRRAARETADELTGLGEELRRVLVERGLRDYFGGV
jgi:DNA-binding transcriptional MerR regulator